MGTYTVLVLHLLGCLEEYENYVACKETAELIDLAESGEALGLTEDEIAFYGALKTNDSAVKLIPCGQ